MRVTATINVGGKMEAAANTSIWAVLWPVIIGGIIAVIGTTITPVITHGITSKAARAEKREQLFTSMLAALFEFDHWLDTKRDTYVYGFAKDLSYSPLAKAIAVASMHFPEAIPLLRDLEIKANKYQIWMTEAAQRRMQGNFAALNDGFTEAYEPYSKAVVAFHAKIPDMVAKYKLSA
jgi:hypothetical protein